MAQFQKKPVIVDAMQFTGANAAAILAWAQTFDPNDTSLDIHGFNDGSSWGEGGCIIVNASAGQLQANATDWVIRGSLGDYTVRTAAEFTAYYNTYP